MDKNAAQPIKWDLFESPYWSPEKGQAYNVVLANWRMEFRSYDEEKTEKPVMLFDVLRINEHDYPLGRKLFVTGAASFAEGVKKIVLDAEARGKQTIDIYLEFGRDKIYRVIDRDKVRGYIEPNPHG